MTTPRKSPATIPRSPASGVGNSRFTNYLQNKSPTRSSPASRLDKNYTTSTTPRDSRQVDMEDSLGEEINGLGNDIRDLYHFISTKNTPEGAKKTVYGPGDIDILVKDLIKGVF